MPQQQLSLLTSLLASPQTPANGSMSLNQQAKKNVRKNSQQSCSSEPHSFAGWARQHIHPLQTAAYLPQSPPTLALRDGLEHVSSAHASAASACAAAYAARVACWLQLAGR
ncbi:hypothetical protein BZA05DRAFT_433168 [Tricharina praecox]|uniref:uncharacterized protein n=1 Tax=Tricharina praecox TaxID=43433 RepID=UPI00221E8ABA|nr:uncharacterized protein BZA05DRAFT_433168 [Tricharina praecox]KAI5857739.1 hypothetical protein BZA05DRAFT_433168 [Tricharina praecox]